MREVQECPKGSWVDDLSLKWIAAAVAVIAAAGVVFGISVTLGSHNRTRLDLVKGISIDDIEISGYDGSAVAKVDDEALRDLIEYDGDNDEVGDFIETVTFEVSPDSDLCNDDSITVKAVYDRTDAKDAKVKVTDDNVTFTVTGLDYESEYDSGYDSDNSSYSDDDYDDSGDDYYEDSNYYTYLVNAWDGFAAVRTGRGTDFQEVGRIWNDESVDVYNYSNGWYEIATGKWKGYYIHESSLEDY